jgi:hypothetical protein
VENISISLEDWQTAALQEMARARGIEIETLAHSILNERLIERIHTSFDDLLPSRNQAVTAERPSADTIEQRLRGLFDA